jgi:Spy/CpxP family protein refolding chaperone
MQQRAGILSLALLVLGVPVAAAGQPRGGPSHKWWESPEVKTELGLTDQQSADVEAIFQETLPKLRAAKEGLDRLEAKLSEVIAASNVDEARITQLVDRVEAARSEMSKIRTLMLFRFYRVLSPEQRTKLKAYYARRDRGRRSWSAPECH